MINVMLRGVIVYVTVILSVRLMGKRQIGELQPSELVTTFLLSEVASMPLQNKDCSLLSCFVLLSVIVSLEIIFSVIAVKSPFFRRLTQGRSVLVIKDGRLLNDKMAKLRYSVDDLLEALRLKDIFDISKVNYAYVETNGSLSVMLNEKDSPVTAGQLKLPTSDVQLPCLVVSDGKIIEKDFQLCGMTREKLYKIIRKRGLEINGIFLMTADKNGKYVIVERQAKG